MKSARIIIACFILVSLSSCPQPEGPPAMNVSSAQRTFKLPYERVWNAAIAVMSEDLKLDMDEVVRETGLISTKWVTYERKPGDFVDASRPESFKKEPLLLEYKVVVMVKIAPDGTVVRARRYQKEFQDRWNAVPTDLTFERQLLNMIAERLGVSDR